jgi:hypothetical protein
MFNHHRVYWSGWKASYIAIAAVCKSYAILPRICSGIRKETGEFCSHSARIQGMRLRIIANDVVHPVPLTPLREKSGTGVVGAVQVVDGHWVMIGDPRATFFEIWHSAGFARNPRPIGRFRSV